MYVCMYIYVCTELCAWDLVDYAYSLAMCYMCLDTIYV